KNYNYSTNRPDAFILPLTRQIFCQVFYKFQRKTRVLKPNKQRKLNTYKHRKELKTVASSSD
ncbi:MAG: hypothetical protein FWF66_02500, partial [Candidatus Bathyarchaeota archaeon]|nr:hypothetical protein [Candidatus Termiticorpusculum sp.]